MKNSKSNSKINNTFKYPDIKIPPPPYNYNKNIPPIIPQQKKPSLLSSLTESLTMGAGMGIGNEVGKKVFNNIFGEKKENNNQNNQNNLNINIYKCEDYKKLYDSCLIYNNYDEVKCDFVKEDITKYCKI